MPSPCLKHSAPAHCPSQVTLTPDASGGTTVSAYVACESHCEGRSMYILYGGDFTRAPLVQWVLEEGGLAYELRKVNILKGEHRAPEFLAINPAGLVPVLITPEGEVLHEVAALMVYLADRHQLAGLAPAMTDPRR